MKVRGVTCKRGHDLTAPNSRTAGSMSCRICARLTKAKYKRTAKGKAAERRFVRGKGKAASQRRHREWYRANSAHCIQYSAKYYSIRENRLRSRAQGRARIQSIPEVREGNGNVTVGIMPVTERDYWPATSPTI